MNRKVGRRFNSIKTTYEINSSAFAFTVASMSFIPLVIYPDFYIFVVVYIGPNPQK